MVVVSPPPLFSEGRNVSSGSPDFRDLPPPRLRPFIAYLADSPDRPIIQPDFDPMGMERGTGEDLANGAFSQSPAPLVSLLDNPDIYSRPDIVPCTAVVFDTHHQGPDRAPPFPEIAPYSDPYAGGGPQFCIHWSAFYKCYPVGQTKNLLSGYDLLTSEVMSKPAKRRDRIV